MAWHPDPPEDGSFGAAGWVSPPPITLQAREAMINKARDKFRGESSLTMIFSPFA
jgi:hypothetical protein